MSGSEQDEELSAVTLIFGEDELEVDEGGQVLRMSITRDCGLLLCTFHLPRAYPGSLAPVLELSGAFSRDEAVWAEQELSKLFKPGEPVLYECIQALRERFCSEPAFVPTAEGQADKASTAGHLPSASAAAAIEQPQHSQRDEDTQQLQRSALDEEFEALASRIVSGEAFTERRSTFQAHLCMDVRSVREVELVRRVLLHKHAKIRSATHNIMAYRIFDERTQSFMQSCDDDGEAAAGSRLLFLLETMDASNVVVIVSRWFGGILMGGQRFKEINHAAQRLLQEQGLDQRHERQTQRELKPSGNRAHKRK